VPGSAPDLGASSAAQQAQLSLGDSQQVFGRPSEWAPKDGNGEEEDDLEAGMSNLGTQHLQSVMLPGQVRHEGQQQVLGRLSKMLGS